MIKAVQKRVRLPFLRSKKCWAAEEGIALVEVLVALVIFSILVVSITAFFINTFLMVHVAAKKSETLFSVQAGTEEQADTVVGDDDALEIHYPGEVVTAKGKIVQVEETDILGRSVRLEVFVPHLMELDEED